ncbi:MAG: bifunctional diaminohydroxyphosphoribosylaminopyrimidine deaminase/5-amino-6-(5-phosphoribosylamino)uracil reductase RibD [Candidatus Omnitrophota bacterium]
MRFNVKHFMRLALELAAKAEGKTYPNPLVGALIVKNGHVVGQGFHKKAGGPHAEVFALKDAGKKALGATLFCTFEPCAHYGATGPCVKEIVASGIKKVYVGMVDPNPLTRGKGIAFLRKNGIKVYVGFLKREIARLNESFIKAVETNVPFVTVKSAASLDGKIATSCGESKWITSKASRVYAHYLRRYYDAIMVGINTVLKDDPSLEPCNRHHRFVKIIVDSDLKIPLTARLLKTKSKVVIAAVRKNKAKEEQLIKRGVEIIYTRGNGSRVDLKELLKKLNDLKVRNILVEGGAELVGSFLEERLADKALFFIASKIIGGRRALSAVGGEGVQRLDQAVCLKNYHIRRIKEDILIEGYLKYSK